MKNTALLVIDAQVGVVGAAYNHQGVLDNIAQLLSWARNTHTPIVYVQHEEPKGYELEAGSEAWAIHPSITPVQGEPVVAKRASDSFYETTLQEELAARGIEHLVVVGGETEYCIDTTIRRATVEGYDVTLVSDAHTTNDREGAVLPAMQRIAYLNQVVDGFGNDKHAITVKPTLAALQLLAEHIDKVELLADTQKGYEGFEQLLSSLSPEQITAPILDKDWSVKDSMSHLISWQQRTLNLLKAVRDNKELPDPTPGMSEDEINDMFYEKNKARPLNSVLADLHEVQQQTLATLQAMSEEDLNKPISWLDNRAVVGWVIGNNAEHYKEHTQYIQTALKQH